MWSMIIRLFVADDAQRRAARLNELNEFAGHLAVPSGVRSIGEHVVALSHSFGDIGLTTVREG